MKKIFGIILAFFIFITGSVGFAAKEALQTIYIITANDFHGHLRAEENEPGAAKWAGVIAKLRSENHGDTIILGAGDMLTGTLDANTEHGLPSIKIMNALGFKADAVGNHAFDCSLSDVRINAQKAKFSFLSANIIDDETHNIAQPFKPYIIVKDKGVKIGIIGLTTIETKEKATQKNLVGLTVVRPESVAQKYIDEVRQKGAKIVILLTHIGSLQNPNGDILGEITGVLDKVHNVDLAITGHTHLLVAGNYKHIPVLQAGCYGQAVGAATIFYSKKAGKVKSVHVKYVRVKNMPPCVEAEVEKLANDAIAKTDAKYNVVLAQNKYELNNDMLGQSATGEYFCDLLRTAMHTDIVVFNGGGVRAQVPAGKVTYRTIKDVFPFPNNMVALKMTGKEIRAVLEHGINNTGLRMLRFSGLRVKADITKPEGQRILEVKMLDGSQLQDTAVYLVGTNDFLALGGDGFTTFKNCKIMTNYGSIVEMCTQLLQKAKNIDYKGPDGRLQY